MADSSLHPYNTIQTISRQFSKTRGTKLTFYYFMYGDSIRDLTVIIKYGEVLKEIWKMYGHQGNQWMKAEVVFYSPMSFNVSVATSY